MRRLTSMKALAATDVPEDVAIAVASVLGCSVTYRRDDHILHFRDDTVNCKLWLYKPKRYPKVYHLGIPGDAGWSMPDAKVIDCVTQILTMVKLGVHPKLTEL